MMQSYMGSGGEVRLEGVSEALRQPIRDNRVACKFSANNPVPFFLAFWHLSSRKPCEEAKCALHDPVRVQADRVTVQVEN